MENKPIGDPKPTIYWNNLCEAAMARHESIIKRFIVVLIVTTSLLFASNIVWAYIYTKTMSEYDYIETEEQLRVHISTEGGGDANYIGNDGDILNGENNSIQKTDNQSTNP